MCNVSAQKLQLLFVTFFNCIQEDHEQGLTQRSEPQTLCQLYHTLKCMHLELVPTTAVYTIVYRGWDHTNCASTNFLYFIHSSRSKNNFNSLCLHTSCQNTQAGNK